MRAASRWTDGAGGAEPGRDAEVADDEINCVGDSGESCFDRARVWARPCPPGSFVRLKLFRRKQVVGERTMRPPVMAA